MNCVNYGLREIKADFVCVFFVIIVFIYSKQLFGFIFQENVQQFVPSYTTWNAVLTVKTTTTNVWCDKWRVNLVVKSIKLMMVNAVWKYVLSYKLKSQKRFSNKGKSHLHFPQIQCTYPIFDLNQFTHVKIDWKIWKACFKATLKINLSLNFLFHNSRKSFVSKELHRSSPRRRLWFGR